MSSTREIERTFSLFLSQPDIHEVTNKMTNLCLHAKSIWDSESFFCQYDWGKIGRISHSPFFCINRIFMDDKQNDKNVWHHGKSIRDSWLVEIGRTFCHFVVSTGYSCGDKQNDKNVCHYMKNPFETVNRFLYILMVGK